MPNTVAKIIIPDDFPSVISGTPALQTMQAHGAVTVYTSRPETQDELVSRIREAHTVVNIRAYCKFTAEVLQACPHLKHLAIWGTGTDNVDLAAAGAAGIAVTNTPNTATEAVAEQGLALLLAVARKIPSLDAQVKRGEWARGMLTQVCGKILGIIGTGAIGLRMAQLGRGIRGANDRLPLCANHGRCAARGRCRVLAPTLYPRYGTHYQSSGVCPDEVHRAFPEHGTWATGRSASVV